MWRLFNLQQIKKILDIIRMKDLKLKDKICSREVVVGSWITIGHPSVVELMCESGVDWLAIDLEHNPIDQETLRNLIITGQSKDVPMFVRVPKNDEVWIKHALDVGADGIIVPMIETYEDAINLVNYSHYPPVGKRGIGLARAQMYGDNFENYLNWCRSNLTVIAQIEHINAINNLDQILSVEGIDGLFIGPYDLSASLGKPGMYDDESVKNALEIFRKKAFSAGVPIGQHVVPLDEWRIQEGTRHGYSFFAYGTDFQFLRKAKEAIKRVKALLE